MAVFLCLTPESVQSIVLCMAPTSELCTADKVAEMLDVKPESVRRWARQGKLPFVQLPSGRMRFRREDVVALLEQKPESESPAEVSA